MSIAPLNNSAAGDTSTAYASQNVAPKPAPVVSTVAPVAAPEARSSTEKEVDEAVGKLNDFAANKASALNFSKDKDTGQTIIKVVDTATDTVIRQIPSEEAISIAKSIDKMQGLLLNQKA